MHRVVAQLKRRLATQGHELKGRKRHAHVDVRRTMRASLQTGGVPIELKYRPRRPRRPEIFVLCDVSTSVTSASTFFLSVLHALHDSFRKLRSFVFIERISEVTEVFERERDFRAASEAVSRDAGVADISGYTDYGRVWTEFLALIEDELHPRATVIVLGDARTNGRPPRDDVFAAITARAGPDLLAEPRAAPVLELRRLGDRRLRAALHGVRVLAHGPARGVRQGADAPDRRARPALARLVDEPRRDRARVAVGVAQDPPGQVRTRRQGGHGHAAGRVDVGGVEDRTPGRGPSDRQRDRNASRPSRTVATRQPGLGRRDERPEQGLVLDRRGRARSTEP